MSLPRIVLTGTFASGKTTVLDQLRRNPLVLVVDEVARELLKDDPRAELDPGFQDRLFEEQLKREDKAEKDAKVQGSQVIVLDRGVLDIIAYSEVLGHQVKREWVQSLNSRYAYVLIFNKDGIADIPQLLELGIDVDRYRSDIDAKLREVVTRYGLPHKEIYGDRQRRLALVESAISLRISERARNAWSIER